MARFRPAATNDIWPSHKVRKARSTQLSMLPLTSKPVPETDTYYQLTPKGVRWYKLRKKQEAFQIMAHDERALMILEHEMGIDVFEHGPVNECNRTFDPHASFGRTAGTRESDDSGIASDDGGQGGS